MSALSLGGILIWLALVMVIDIRTRRIPNILSLGAITVGVTVLLVSGQTLTHEPAASAILGLLIALILTLPAYILKMLGAGDVKLLAGIALLCGLQMMLQTYVFASAVTLVMVLLQIKLPVFNVGMGNERSKRFIPYGAALAASLSFILVFPDSLGLDRWRINELLFT